MAEGLLLLRVISILIAVKLSDTSVLLTVAYPEVDLSKRTGNFSIVTLSCMDGAFPLPSGNDVDFLQNGTSFTSGTELVTVTDADTFDEISFVFTQAQEGFFRCSSGGQTSARIGLAASPANSDGMMTERFITFPKFAVLREVVLSCPIRPGALVQRYSVKWQQMSPRILLSDTTYDISVNISSSQSLISFACRVTIEHMDNLEVEYPGQEIVIHTNVLATIDDGPHKMSIIRGESANFTCEISERSNDIDVYWTVDGVQYDCHTSEDNMVFDNIGCYNTKSQSVLLILDAQSFATGSYQVYCIIEQNIGDNFTSDPSFQVGFSHPLMEGSSLTIEPTIPQLDVTYPQPNRHSLVHLSCQRGSIQQIEATFLKDEVVLTSGQATHQVTVVENGRYGEILFTFTQAQEGMFSCHSRGHSSTTISLAASPTMSYEDVVTERYILFPTSDSSREITLTCPIRPGALAHRYSVEWLEYTADNNEVKLLNSKDFDLSISTDPSSSRQYQCIVTILHRNDTVVVEGVYNGSLINLNKQVLAAFTSELRNMSVDEGDTTELKSEFSKGSIDVDVYWTVDGLHYNCLTSEDMISDNIGCYNTESQSVLLIDGISSGSHTVQCVLQQNIPEAFENDFSFQPNYTQVTQTAMLTVISAQAKESLGPAEWAGIGVGLLVCIGVIVVFGFLCYYCCRCRKSSSMKVDVNELDFMNASNPAPQCGDDEAGGAVQVQPQENGAVDTPRAIPAAVLVEDLQDLACQWYALGVHLGLKASRLNVIKGELSAAGNNLERVLEEWLKGAGEPCTKKILVEVLKGGCLNKKRLAKKIENDSDLPDEIDSSSHALLSKKLNELAGHYDQLSVLLGVGHDKTQEIEHRVGRVRKNLSDMLHEWLEEERPPTDVIRAIRNPPINNAKLATHLEEKWKMAGYIVRSTI